MSLHYFAISIAVSTLSPVRTQNQMSVFKNASIVSGTSSCNWSSIAVHPTN